MKIKHQIFAVFSMTMSFSILNFVQTLYIIANYYSLEAEKGNFQCCTVNFMHPANGVQYLYINEENILFQAKKTITCSFTLLDSTSIYRESWFRKIL